ncbi:MAG: hypothetical protein KDD11_02960 [Acidobacteria bacterium]|nr:hypothetical protein [Acidobacteriota bacterium]
MSASTGADAPGATEHAYFQAVEQIFIGLRGAPLLLSPADYRVAVRWHQAGIPLDLIREVLEQVFTDRRNRGVKDPVSSLRYLQRAVERAWEEARELSAGARRSAAAELEVPPRLEALASRLEAVAGEAAQDLAPEAASRLVLTATRIRALEGSAETVERQLGRLDQELVEIVEASLAGAVADDVEARLTQSLARLAARVPAEELERARLRLRRQLIRDRFQLPVLSLFSPEAEA